MNNEQLKTNYDLHHYFNVKAKAILTKYKRKMMGWDEIYHPELPKDMVIQSWHGLESLNMFTNRSYLGVLSTGFYIEQPQYSAYHYRNDPIINNTNRANIAFDKSDQHRNDTEVDRLRC
jgi:hexosaminidase